MSIVTEETARRIADSLERLEGILKTPESGTPAEPPILWPERYCGMCRGYHTADKGCPRLTAGSL